MRTDTIFPADVRLLDRVADGVVTVIPGAVRKQLIARPRAVAGHGAVAVGIESITGTSCPLPHSDRIIAKLAVETVTVGIWQALGGALPRFSR